MITSSSLSWASVWGIVISEISDFGFVVFVLGFEGSESSFFFDNLFLGFSSSTSSTFGWTSSIFLTSSTGSTLSLTKNFFLGDFFSSGLVSSSMIRDFFLSSTFFFGLVSCVGSVSDFLSVFGLSLDGVSCVTSSSIVCWVSSGVWLPFVKGQPSSSGSSSFRGNIFYYMFFLIDIFFFKSVNLLFFPTSWRLLCWPCEPVNLFKSLVKDNIVWG